MEILKTTQMMVLLGEGDLVDVEHGLVKVNEDVYKSHFPIKGLGTNKTVISYLYPEQVPDDVSWEKYTTIQ